MVTPEGKANEGIPDKFAGAEKISHKYIATGSSSFSPNLNGSTGTVGVAIKLTSSKTFSISAFILARTFRALL